MAVCISLDRRKETKIVVNFLLERAFGVDRRGNRVEASIVIVLEALTPAAKVIGCHVQ